ncbi:putative dehydrogenase [Ereboglobus sp. PH5-10]|uniref:Gfo/Idh/MocA family protein n=1 Tax=Ereboglobus sp. PH5-10 TaxID=2940629 RepID=UPI002405EA75|nr:Gfo/Idh/MocA family oxidoreductase [Ereboglobus sp. PH5-10]MDF9827819.1 putative dehydrogenase [Ereboglobus sp. PH5-10]
MKKTKHINVAVVGLGFMGVTHLRAWQKVRNARIVAVCDAIRQPENGVLRGVSGNIKRSDDIHLGAKVRSFREFDALLEAPGVDVIDICTPTALHPAQVIAALRAGRHVLCEKPLASTSAETKKILQVAKKSRGFLMPAMCMRFWPGWRELKELIAKNTHGRLLSASFRRVSQMPGWNAAQTYSTAAAGGALYDLHIHDTDFVHYLFGRPASVFSSGVTGPNGAINHIVTQYQYPKGPAVSATGTWLHQGAFNMGFTLNFERATLTCDLTNGGAWHIDAIGKKTRVIKPRGTDGYDAEIRYFADCLARGAAPEAVTVADAVATLQTCEAEERSVRQSRCVKLA